ncbi:unnamed protein product, partial [marine sediment metagenome]
QPYQTPQQLSKDLLTLQLTINNEHDGLYADKVDHLISAVNCFGFNFASLDIRQDARVHSQLVHDILQKTANIDYRKQNAAEQINTLHHYLAKPAPALPEFPADSVEYDIVDMIKALPSLQQIVGERGIHRYILSNTQSAQHVLELLLLCHWCGIDAAIDIIPLFESIDDLTNAADIMDTLYQDAHYAPHLQQRHGKQTIMLGFSDGTKDGGYLTANWAIYQAKVHLQAISEQHAIHCVFFDGRGGPPARGGGNTHNFYRALTTTLPQRELQLTLQGQTISTNFGTLAAAQYNIGQLYTAGLADLDQPAQAMPKSDQLLLEELSTLSADYYQQLIHHAKFLPYLEHITPMPYFGELNIASRPPRRSQQGPLSLDNLRAITFV